MKVSGWTQKNTMLEGQPWVIDSWGQKRWTRPTEVTVSACTVAVWSGTASSCHLSRDNRPDCRPSCGNPILSWLIFPKYSQSTTPGIAGVLFQKMIDFCINKNLWVPEIAPKQIKVSDGLLGFPLSYSPQNSKATLFSTRHLVCLAADNHPTLVLCCCIIYSECRLHSGAGRSSSLVVTGRCLSCEMGWTFILQRCPLIKYNLSNDGSHCFYSTLQTISSQHLPTHWVKEEIIISSLI